MPRSANSSTLTASAFYHSESEPVWGINHFLPPLPNSCAGATRPSSCHPGTNGIRQVDTSGLRDLVTRRAIVSLHPEICCSLFFFFVRTKSSDPLSGQPDQPDDVARRAA